MREKRMRASRLRRKPFIWDNHIANDGRARCSHLYLDFWAQGWSIDADMVAGIAINPMNQPHLSRIPLASFGDSSVQADCTFAASVRSICGAALGEEITRDLDLFQHHGLAELDPGTRARLLEKYRGFESPRCSLEIGEWLRGGYEFDPNCLTE